MACAGRQAPWLRCECRTVHCRTGSSEIPELVQAPALDALDRAFSVRDTRLVNMKDDGRRAGSRDRPRFIAMLPQMKLNGCGPGTSAY